MGINQLSLSPELMAALYPESLVTVNAVRLYPFLGENKQRVSFIVDSPGEEFLSPGSFDFLKKILAACRYQAEDIAILNIARSPVHFKELKKQLRPRIVFLWGTEPGSVGLEAGLNDFLPTEIDGVRVLVVPGTGLMGGDSKEGLELKQRLWACLKKMFSL